MHLLHRLRPHVRKLRRVIGVVEMQAVHFAATRVVVVRYRTDERIVVIHYLAVFDDDQPDALPICHRNTITVLLLWRLITLGLHTIAIHFSPYRCWQKYE